MRDPMSKIENIRNFSIIAHSDHGKSTLADRILEITGLVGERDRREQYLDRMDLERERGITIKSQTVRLPYKAADGVEYILNLIDTPGHVDFSYEVSRSLAACEGALLVVDATQGVEAQTLANVFLALENDLEIIPVLNKIDLPSSDPEGVIAEIEEIIGLDCSEAIMVSAKTGENVPDVLEAIVQRIPAPKGDADASLKALIFDSWYDSYRGVTVLFRMLEGRVSMGQKIRIHTTRRDFDVTHLGSFSPEPVAMKSMGPGDVGFLCASMKELSDAPVGDTVTDARRPTDSPFPGFKQIKPMVFCGLYPVEPAEYEPGFLGLLHMEIIQERLEREFGAQLITTAPSVAYKVVKLDGQTIYIDNPSKLPDPQEIDTMAEPFARMEIHVPGDYVGAVLKLCEEKRGVQRDMRYLTATRVMITYDMPFNEVVYDFFDKLKSVTKGYASLDYEVEEFREADLVKLDMLINGDPVDALSIIVHRERATPYGRKVALKLKRSIPRQLFEVVVQAAIGQRIIARERNPALRKNVTAKCYGGDISRKRKLLEKQKAGKKRMKKMGNVEIPQEAFLAALKADDD